jgi:CIC family chloride channel protein
VLVAKIAACAVALSSGFRGGLFFASLFLGSVVGQAFSIIAGQLVPGLALDPPMRRWSAWPRSACRSSAGR